MRLFANLINDSITPLASFDNFRESDLPAEFRHIERTKNSDILSLDTHCSTLGEQGEVRGLYISSAKIEVVNLFFFPNPAYALPIYAMEFVIISQRPQVGVIDMLCMDKHPLLATKINTIMRHHASSPCCVSLSLCHQSTRLV